ncbi:uncharacterized protein (TIGR03067 family) [Neorhizobium galegae]|uniref:TIGR03067 domain-containing protein n=1 Tax=Neorhizobium galegae TaxID=399 RepID=UPI001AEA2CF5|nr:TIGR03067 domain-containing protein [Neorhizobium galegae]MBP2550257.1 uncharacterized protein (TIGR03067 family) [Neorhizobium galegae]
MASDLELLQGTWRQIRFEENGLVDPPDSHGAPGAILTIEGTGFHVAVPGGEPLVAGCFILHSATAPKGIDWIDTTGADAGARLPAIYTLSADTFEFAAADADMARPMDLSGGMGITVRAFVRA